MEIQTHNLVMESGIPHIIVLEYSKEVSASDVFAVVRSSATDDNIVAKFEVIQLENTDIDVKSTFKLKLGGDIDPGRYVYDVFVYSNDKPKAKILKGHILVKGSVSDRGRLNAD